jgi:hypothetical protein
MTSNANKLNFKRLEKFAYSVIDWTDGCRCRHFSFIIYKKKIVAIGTNRKKTHPTNLIHRKVSIKTGMDFSDQKHTCSEFNAVSRLKNLTNINTKKCTLINLRYNRNKKIALASPCMSCISLLKHHEFKSVLFTTDNGNYEQHSYNE